jgi:hypothetical protein
MKINELKAKLKELNVPSALCSLGGGLPSEKYCIEERSGRWYTYYSERGERTGLKEFISEEDACEHFLKEMKRGL